jgi:phosphoribosyl 1,2-cyclic phosphodiesterase
MKLFCIASGSSGNCLYFDTGEHSFLVDAGVSSKRICNSYKNAGFRDPEAVFVTHEHSDHIMGLEVFLKAHPIPVFGTKGTLAAVMASFKGDIPVKLFMQITPEKEYAFNGVRFIPHSAPHDATDPVFYTFTHEDRKTVVITDVGEYTDEFVKAAKGAAMLYLESNHDPNMLMAGSYPFSLKQRVLSSHGHLSNDSAAEFAVKVMEPGLKHIILGHLSKENNYPELAYETMRSAVAAAWKYGPEMPEITVANRDIPTGPFEY